MNNLLLISLGLIKEQMASATQKQYDVKYSCHIPRQPLLICDCISCASGLLSSGVGDGILKVSYFAIQS